MNDFREDLKRMMTEVLKNDGKGTAFLFSDTQIVKDISDLLDRSLSSCLL